MPKKNASYCCKAHSYGHYEIQTIADRFSLDPTIASKEWINLLISMIKKDGYCDKLNQKPEHFFAILSVSQTNQFRLGNYY